MEFFRNSTIDWIGKKWYFIAVSLLLSTVGIVSLVVKGGPRYGIDFRGGTQVHVKFREAPSLDRLRAALRSQGLDNSTLQSYGPESNHEILIGLDLVVTKEEDLDAGRATIVNALRREFGGGEKANLNEASTQAIADQLLASESLRSSGSSPEQIQNLARRLAEFRDSPPRSGLISNFEELRQVEGVTPAVLQALEDHFSLANFTVRNVEIVGPKVGAALRRQALNATLLGMVAMLVYIAFRFEWIYGVAAVLALLHDVVIAVGFLSLANFEISLTVIAALLTLIGYSVNDTIVIFDRIRENVKLMRRASITEIANRSINQTLSRTILTSGLTFLAVLALFLFGGEVLRGFSFTLVVGIIVGSYSTIAIASTVVVSWQEYNNRDRQGAVATLERELGKGDRAKLSAGAKA
ncbi:MAG: protein-export membrane protein SecF [Acidobacteria bacterium RIFCSPLOWO2_12_FULL_59_11]|nr:MAG: protein-export membrane protein SecF [Acidobacteria bacterium RIFCSPLOWO2_12_FULL_59_11]